MRKKIGLYSVAFTTLMLAISPAWAISLNIGGDGGLVSVDSGNAGSGDDSGGGSSDDDLLNLDGNRLLDLSGDDDADAAVEIDLGVQGGGADGGVLGNDGLVDLDSGGDDGVIVDLFGPEEALADVDLGLEGDDGLGDDGLVDIDTDGDNGVTAKLFGAEGAVADIDLGLNGESGVTGDGLVDVNSDGGAAVNADLLRGSAAPSSLAALDVDGTDLGSPVASEAATIALFGDDGTEAGAGDDGVDDTTTGSTASPGDGSDGTDGTDGTGAAPASPAGPATMQPMRPAVGTGGGSLRVATATTGAARCFSPDQGQIAHLLARNDNGIEIAAQIDEAEDVKIVPVNLCEDARAQLDAALASDADLGVLQSAIASDADVSAALEPSYQPEDVMAADQSGEDLTVYVY